MCNDPEMIVSLTNTRNISVESNFQALEGFVKAFTGVELPHSVLKEQLFGKESDGKNLAGDYFLKVWDSEIFFKSVWWRRTLF